MMWRAGALLIGSLLCAAPAVACAQDDPEAAIGQPTAWPETETAGHESACRSIPELLARLSAEHETRAVRGNAALAYGVCRLRSFVGDATAPAAARGTWRRVVTAARAFLRARPEGRFLRRFARERRERLAALADMHGGRVTAGPIQWELTLQFRMDEGGTVHVSLSRQADQALRSVVRRTVCAPCVAPGPCACGEGTDTRDETVSWGDWAYIRVPPRGPATIVRIGDPET